MLFKNTEQIIANGQTTAIQLVRRDILDILTAAVDAVNPYTTVKQLFKDTQLSGETTTIELSDFNHIYVVGFGKACVGMAQAVCDRIPITKGVVVTNESSAKVKSRSVETIVGGHPIPNTNSVVGTEKIMSVVADCNDNDLLLVLISGGGSALFCKPRVSLTDLQKTTDLLLQSGADINSINAVRKHLSLVKGGQLLRSIHCTVVSLIISDIVGDPLEFIASGPTSPDSTTYSDAETILKQYNLWSKVPSTVQKVITNGIQGDIPETPGEDDPIFEHVINQIIANNTIACDRAVEKAYALGYHAEVLTTSLTGEARVVGHELINKIESLCKKDTQNVFISGGETTVTLQGDGRGGRNQEVVLGVVEAIAGLDVVLASFATDGIDGNSDAAGAIADGYTFMRATKKGLDPQRFLMTNNSYGFFSLLDDLFITGSTGTNVMDLQVLVKAG